MKKTLRSFFFLFSLFTLTACSLQRLALRQMNPVFEKGVAAFFEEEDLELAQPALAANLKLMEGILKSDPQNERLLLLLAQGYAGYALAFAEDTAPERARKLYLRARNYARQALFLQCPSLNENWSTDIEHFKQNLKHCGKKQVPALFWTAFSWAGYINLSLEDPAALLDLPLVEALMARVLEQDSTYFYGGALLFFGSLYGQKPPLLGGNPQKANEFFQRNLKMTGGKFLLTYIYAARFYAAKILDENLFDQYLQTVLDTPLSVAPEIRMLNQIAKQKAHRLQSQKEELF